MGIKSAIRVSDKKLASLTSRGIGIHHAGLDWQDRKCVEDLFKTNQISVLCKSIPLDTIAHNVRLIIIYRYHINSGCWGQSSRKKRHNKRDQDVQRRLCIWYRWIWELQWSWFDADDGTCWKATIWYRRRRSDYDCSNRQSTYRGLGKFENIARILVRTTSFWYLSLGFFIERYRLTLGDYIYVFWNIAYIW